MYNDQLYNKPLFSYQASSSPLHYLFDGSYRTAPRPINRVLVVGADTDSNNLTGTAADSAEIALVGERLEILLAPSIISSTLAAQVAAAVLAKARLDTRDGFITLPPHCGVELWDVITIYDNGADQEGVPFRVTGIKLVYHPTTPHYYQVLTLCAV